MQLPRLPLLSFTALCLTALTVGRVQAQEPHPIAAGVKAALKDATKPFTMIVRIKVKEGTGKKFEAAFRKALAPTRKEEGNLAYQLNRDAKTPTQYIVYERWRNLEALEAHLKSEHITTLLTTVGEMLDGEPELQVLVPIGGVGKKKAN